MRREGASALAGAFAVVATYVSFLLHAQFGFLALVARHAGASRGVAPIMAAMGGAGLLASLATGACLARVSARRLAMAGFLGCAAAALLSLACRSVPSFMAVALLIGAATATLTVALAAGLRSILPVTRIGLTVGAATGCAYFISNLPMLFHGGPVAQALAPAALCLVAAAGLALTGGPAAASEEATPVVMPSGSGESSAAWAWLAFVSLVASFLALVWLDSAAFRIVQETATLQGRTWGPGARTLGQGLAHLVAAAVAGHLVDRGRMRSLLLATFALFVVAFTQLMTSDAPRLAGPLYAFGISAYSTALVLAPTLRGAEALALAPRWRAAALYAIAGWLGSALGVGMAQDLHRIPAAFIVAAGAVLVTGLMLSSARALKRARHSLAPAGLLALPGLALVLAPALRGGPAPAAASDRQPSAARGREVYVAEGCIHCHSQYLRPGIATDEAAWGPRRSDQMSEHPPLIGMRRIGPDLLDVGARRNAAWLRLHLIEPHGIAPGSAMPSYAHLFAPGDARGEDLALYLQGLGAGLAGTRAERARAWLPGRAALAAASPDRGRDLFAGRCAPCHGPAGRGDGPLAASVASPFLDLAMPGLPRVDRVTGDSRVDLMRVIRFGLPGTAMAGHELLSDAELASLALHVETLRSRAGSAP